ncbi:MAG: HigA family addiction module antitoxin [Bacteroidota bacterium]
MSKIDYDSLNVSAPIHPGEILFEEFMKPLHVSQNALARDISVSPRRVNEIVNAKRAITPDTALRLSMFFGTSEMFWMNLQASYEMDLLTEAERVEISGQVKPRARVSDFAVASGAA